MSRPYIPPNGYTYGPRPTPRPIHGAMARIGVSLARAGALAESMRRGWYVQAYLCDRAPDYAARAADGIIAAYLDE